jgi:hypothetical protein
LTAAALAKGIGGFFSELFNLGNGGGGGGSGSGSGGTGDPDDPGFVTRVYWKDIKQIPFAAKTGGLVAIDGDLLVSSSRRLRSISAGTFSTDLDTGSRVVSDTENAQVTFIDFDYQRFYGKRFIARETDAFAAYTPFGVGFGDAEGNAFNTPVLTPTSIRYGNWALSANGLVHKNAQGVYKKILWNDGAGYEQKNYHFFGVIDSTLQDATESGPTSDTLRDRLTAPNNTRNIDNARPPEITAAPTQSASPSIAQRAQGLRNRFDGFMQAKSTQLSKATDRAGTALERKALQATGNAALKAKKIGKALQPDAVAKAAGKAMTRFLDKSSDTFTNLGRVFKRI